MCSMFMSISVCYCQVWGTDTHSVQLLKTLEEQKLIGMFQTKAFSIFMHMYLFINLKKMYKKPISR